MLYLGEMFEYQVNRAKSFSPEVETEQIVQSIMDNSDMSKVEFIQDFDKQLSQVEQKWLVNYFKSASYVHMCATDDDDIKYMVKTFMNNKYFLKLGLEFYDGIIKNPLKADKLYESIPEYEKAYCKIIDLCEQFEHQKKAASGLTFMEIWNFNGLIDYPNMKGKVLWSRVDIMSDRFCDEMDRSHMYMMKCFKLVYEMVKYRPEGEGAKEAKKDFEEQQLNQSCD